MRFSSSSSSTSSSAYFSSSSSSFIAISWNQCTGRISQWINKSSLQNTHEKFHNFTYILLSFPSFSSLSFLFLLFLILPPSLLPSFHPSLLPNIQVYWSEDVVSMHIVSLLLFLPPSLPPSFPLRPSIPSTFASFLLLPPSIPPSFSSPNNYWREYKNEWQK